MHLCPPSIMSKLKNIVNVRPAQLVMVSVSTENSEGPCKFSNQPMAWTIDNYVNLNFFFSGS